MTGVALLGALALVPALLILMRVAGVGPRCRVAATLGVVLAFGYTLSLAPVAAVVVLVLVVAVLGARLAWPRNE
mgnify:CR=1 FL=1